jgi:4-hydroxybenzoate polyprenyltransferase
LWTHRGRCLAPAAPPSPQTPPPPTTIDSDGEASTWLDRSSRVPPAIVPYLKLARADRPIGTWLLLWPCLWGQALATPAGALPDAVLSLKFAVGALVMRGAGCTINDMWDREYDRRVARTRDRPLASGALTPRAAGAFLGAQLLTGLGVLLTFDAPSIALASASLGLVATYPLAKRFVALPQLMLGLTFNWGALVGFSAVQGPGWGWGGVPWAPQWDTLSVGWAEAAPAAPLYLGCVCWTMVYDTLYAHQDKADDAKIGLRSSALTFGDAGTRPALLGFAAASVGGIAAAGVAAGAGPLYFAGVAAGGAHMAWQVLGADLGSRADLARRFKSNVWVGALVFAGALGDRVAVAAGLGTGL